MSEQPVCGLCGEPMPAGEEMFQYHGHSGPCPKPSRPAPANPYCVERRDDDDGSIIYEIWDSRPGSCRRLCSVGEEPADEDETPLPRGQAKTDAELIARALNLMNGTLP